MVSGTMDCRRIVDRLKGTVYKRFLLFTIWFSTFGNVVYLKVLAEQYHLPSHHELVKTPSTTGLFQPIQISPSVIPHYPSPTEPTSPLYPTFPKIYKPVLTGNCPANFSAVSDIIDRTALDCSQPLASFVGNVICCPQFGSLLHIFQGYHSTISDKLVFQESVANDCFSDIITILASKGANSSISQLCSVKPSNITGGSCPVKDVNSFEKVANTSQLLDACSSVDPLKECCRPVCQSAIADAALQLAGHLTSSDSKDKVGGAVNTDVLYDCKGVIYSWLSRKLSAETANTVFRMLSSCKVNKVCPLEFKHPLEVVKQCRNTAAPSPSCCSSLNSYISGIQKQMLITNKQAIICSTIFASMLQKNGVMTDLYELCDVDLKDFSLQVTAFGQQGCLLRSLPADVVFDNVTGYSFTCDLNDNIGAPWPSSSSMSSFSLCAPEMSLPALPMSKNTGIHGYHHSGWELILPIIFVISAVLY